MVHLKLWSDVFWAFKAQDMFNSQDILHSQDIFNSQDIFHLQLFSIFSTPVAPLLCQSYRSIVMSDLRFHRKCIYLDSIRIHKQYLTECFERNLMFENTETCFLWIASSLSYGLGEQQTEIEGLLMTTPPPSSLLASSTLTRNCFLPCSIYPETLLAFAFVARQFVFCFPLRRAMEAKLGGGLGKWKAAGSFWGVFAPIDRIGGKEALSSNRSSYLQTKPAQLSQEGGGGVFFAG